MESMHEIANWFFDLESNKFKDTSFFLVLLLLVLCYCVNPKSMLDSNKITEEYTAVQKS